MQKRMRCLLLMLALAEGSAVFAGQSETPPSRLDSVAPLFSQPSMNVFRRFDAEPSAMYNFYSKVLGLKQLQTFNLGGGTGVARFQAGASQVKLTGKVPNRTYYRGKVQDATGLRLLSFFFPDRKELVERFRANGLPEPQFQALPGSSRLSAMVTDPDGQWVELLVAPGEPKETYEQIEIGLVVSDISASRKFYREFVGLEELPPVEDPIFNTTKYPYRHGSTIVSLRSFGASLPADTGTGGIQYVVSDVKAVDALAKARNITIDQPLSTLAGFGLQTIWLDDPDHITNYFAQTGVGGKQPPKKN